MTYEAWRRYSVSLAIREIQVETVANNCLFKWLKESHHPVRMGMQNSHTMQVKDATAKRSFIVKKMKLNLS